MHVVGYGLEADGRALQHRVLLSDESEMAPECLPQSCCGLRESPIGRVYSSRRQPCQAAEEQEDLEARGEHGPCTVLIHHHHRRQTVYWFPRGSSAHGNYTVIDVVPPADTSSSASSYTIRRSTMRLT